MTFWARRRAEDRLVRSTALFDQFRVVLTEANSVRTTAALELAVADEKQIESMLSALASERTQLAEVARLYTVAVDLLDRQIDLWRDHKPKEKP